MEEFFLGLPLPVNILLIFGALYVVTRASHYLVDGAIHIAHEFQVSPLIIGATVVAMGTSSCELAVNLVVVLGRGDTSVVVGNILGSNLVNIGIELGVSALIVGLIVVPRRALEKDIPLYFAATGLVTALVFDGQIGRAEAILMLALFMAAVGLIIQYARARGERSVLLVETTEIEAISHPAALALTRGQALLALFGGLAVLVLASRLLIYNTAALALTLHIPEFIIGLAIIGPGTSMPEIASSIQAARRGHADLVVGTAFGSNLFNLLFGLGLPALIRPLAIEETAILSFIFMNAVNLSLLALLLLDVAWLGNARGINRTVGACLVTTYVGFLTFQVVRAAGGTSEDWLKISALMALATGLLLAGWRWVGPLLAEKLGGGRQEPSRGRILCATRGGRGSQPTHQRAIDLAREQGAELLFLYIFDRSVLQKVATPIVINTEAQIEHMLAYLQTTAQEQARQAGVRARVVVRTGNLRQQIKTVIREAQVNLIVLGSPAGDSSLFAREALRDLAAHVEEATGVPVLALDNQDAVLE
jgi:cation:H+ antiporter